MFQEHRDHRIGTTQEGSDAILFLVVTCSVDFILVRMFEVNPTGVWVLFVSMLIGVFASGGLAWRIFSLRRAIKSEQASTAAIEREAETQRKIDAMLRSNSRIPPVARED